MPGDTYINIFGQGSQVGFCFAFSFKTENVFNLFLIHNAEHLALIFHDLRASSDWYLV